MGHMSQVGLFFFFSLSPCEEIQRRGSAASPNSAPLGFLPGGGILSHVLNRCCPWVTYPHTLSTRLIKASRCSN